MNDAKCWSCGHEFEFWSATVHDLKSERVLCPRCGVVNFRPYARSRFDDLRPVLPLARGGKA